MRGRTLQHLWAEFSETLHEQISRDSQGEIIATRWRSTAPAEAFFSTHVLIDTPLRTEFFKHLPGVFTGLGIIGTFLGLIQGLSSFEVTEDPTIARNSLEALLHGVHDAFYVSATAIIVAMIVTLIEKMTISGLARRVELLCQEVDALFAAGAGEEYLAQLVRASETSATQILQLKDSLVGDLKQILFDITDRQVSAINQSAKDIAGDVTRSISESLKAPLDQIARAVDRTTDDRGEAVTQVLTDVLANFSAKLQDMFGGQMGGMTRLLQETTVALQLTIGKFDELASNIGAAGQGAAQAMANRLSEAVTALEGRQSAMNEQMAAFVEQIRDLVRTSQSETSEKLRTMLADIGGQMARAMDDLRKQMDLSSSGHESRQHQLQAQATTAIEGMSGQIGTLAEKAVITTQAMQESVSAMREIVGSAISRMTAGADRLGDAAISFANAGKQVANVMESANTAVQRIETVSGSLTTASSVLSAVMDDYRNFRDALSTMVEELRKAVESAKREATLTDGLLASIKQAAEAMGKAQNDADTYLDSVSKVLAEAHGRFAENVIGTLRASNTAFHGDLAKATDYLKTAIQELGDVVDNMPPGSARQ